MFVYYADDLARIMKKLLLVSQVAALAVQLERDRTEDDKKAATQLRASQVDIDFVVGEAGKIGEKAENEEESVAEISETRSSTKLISDKDEDDNDDNDGFLSSSQKQRIDRILGNWSEPEATPAASQVSQLSIY